MPKDTTQFEKMGTSVPHNVMNMAKGNSKYTTAVPKKTEGRGSSPTGKAGSRSASIIHEANGPRCRIETTLYKANAASASDTGRNLRLLPAKMARGDFWDKRQYGQRTQ